MFSKITTSILLTVLLFSAQSPAQDLSGLPGGFADIGVGAESMGLAGANIVLSRNVYSIVNNPACLTRVYTPQAAFSMTKQFSLIPYNLVLYGQQLGGNHHIGAGFLTSGDDALRENTIYLSYATHFSQRLSVGANFKFRHASFGSNSDGSWIFDGGNRQVHGNAKGASFDLGFMGLLGANMGYAVVLKDFFGTLKYSAENSVGTAQGGDEALAPSVALGFAYVSSKQFFVEFNLEKAISEETHDRFVFGVEQKLLSFFALRAGIGQNIEGDEDNRRVSLGAGITQTLLSKFQTSVDFAYLIADIDNFFHVGLRFSWLKK